MTYCNFEVFFHIIYDLTCRFPSSKLLINLVSGVYYTISARLMVFLLFWFDVPECLSLLPVLGLFLWIMLKTYLYTVVVVVVVVVVFFTLTDRASTIPSNIRGCQSGTCSQRGTKVNGSHHGDNPLLGPTGIQIATKSYATLQAMAPTNNKTVNRTPFTPYREQPR